MRLRRCPLAPCLLGAGLLVAAPAAAGTFASDGTFLFDADAVAAEGFESPVEAPDGSPPAGYEPVEAVDALEGTHVLRAQAQYSSVNVRLTLPTERASYRARSWIRGDAVAGVIVGYGGGVPGDFAQMFPTGRMTSDGWLELASAPFAVDGQRPFEAYAFFFGSVEADGVEVVAAQDAEFRAPRTCSGLADPSCDGDRLCLAGWCRNTEGWVPPVPQGASQGLLTDYLHNRIKFFFGPYFNRKHFMPAALAELEGMRAAPSRWRFWNGFATAVRRLRDSHTSVFSLASWIVENRRLMNTCFVIGDADLSHDKAPSTPGYGDILVSHAGSTHNWSLGPGDRLVAVDGVHPITWMRSLIAHDWSYGEANDQSSHSQFAERMRSSIPRYAQSITVLRCAGGSCSTPEEILVASIPELADDVDPQSLDIVGCDHRPQPLLASQPSNHYLNGVAHSGNVLGTQAEEQIFGMVWDDLVVDSASATTIKNSVASWRSEARGVILDHRTGNGGVGGMGTTASADPILGFVRSPTLFGVDVWRQRMDDEGPVDVAAGLQLVDKLKHTAFAWRGGSSSALTDVPVALLISRDVSFSDLFPHAMKDAPKVRIFGPHPTNGAFSSFLGLSYWLAFNYQLASGDTIAANGITLCGQGAAPDEVVVPRQSDLLVGKDTLVERALQWVRTELKP